MMITDYGECVAWFESGDHRDYNDDGAYCDHGGCEGYAIMLIMVSIAICNLSGWGGCNRGRWCTKAADPWEAC